MQNHSCKCMPKWLIIAGLAYAVGLGSAYAETVFTVPVNGSQWLAMGDVGPIKNDLAPTDASANLKWSELTKPQQAVLSPLAAEWDSLRPWQREKMLDIAKEYPKMDSRKQQRIQSRLVQWSRMTPYERENARKRYQQFQGLSQDKKEVLRKQWKEHQRKSAASEGYDPEFDDAAPAE